MRLLVWLIAHTPLPVAAAMAWLFSWAWWLVIPVRRRLAVASFRAAFPELPPGPALRRSMRGLCLGYCELLRELDRHGTVSLGIEGIEPIAERTRRGEGTLVLAGHFGSWDLVGALLARVTRIPATVIIKIPHSPTVAALIERVRAGYGLGLLANDRGVMPKVYDLLQAGTVVVFALDQRLSRGIAVPFFGRPALTAPSLAAAAAKTGLPVYFAEYWREGVGRHTVRFSGPLAVTGDTEEDTAAFTRVIEEAIRRRPENWLWMHDRWKGAGAAAAAGAAV